MNAILQNLYVGPLGVGLILSAISFVYFVIGRHQSMVNRVLKSSHGILFFCTMFPIVARHYSFFTYAEWLSYLFWVFVLLGVAATAYSLYGYTRRWYFNFLHVLTLLYGALATLYGMNGLPHDLM